MLTCEDVFPYVTPEPNGSDYTWKSRAAFAASSSRRQSIISGTTPKNSALIARSAGASGHLGNTMRTSQSINDSILHGFAVVVVSCATASRQSNTTTLWRSRGIAALYAKLKLRAAKVFGTSTTLTPGETRAISFVFPKLKTSAGFFAIRATSLWAITKNFSLASASKRYWITSLAHEAWGRA
jgi:hypothetical protein